MVKHKRPPGRPPAAGYPPQDCADKGCAVIECQPHECTPLGPATILKIHNIISGALSAAVRWGWIRTNPAEIANKPSPPRPQPKPPTPDEASLIINRAWSESLDWGTFVWLVMVTGLRRAEVIALRWFDIDLDGGFVSVRRNYIRLRGRNIEKDTKTHQMRRVAIDAATVEVLKEHHQRYVRTIRQLDPDAEPKNDAYLFSYEPTYDRPYDPSAATHKYADMCAAIGIDSHLHALRHYSATELLAAGVDLRAVAGRLGHGGRGATTLRVYAAWVDESDRRAADILGGRMKRPQRSSE